MKPNPGRFFMLFAAFLVASGAGHSAESADGFRPLCNGRDLTGWRPINVPADTFTVRDGLIVCTGKLKGFMVYEQPFENFVLELEWRHLTNGGNAGAFVWAEDLPAVGAPFPRAVEIQIMDPGPARPPPQSGNIGYTRHGAVFPIRGATMTPQGRISDNGKRSLPSEQRTRSSPEWNHYRVTCVNGEIRLAVNGTEVTTGKNAVPRKGFVGLESEDGEVHFRNIRVKELPGAGATAEQTAVARPEFRPLFNGADFSGWKFTSRMSQVWRINDIALAAKGGVSGGNFDLWTEQTFRDFELIVDWRLTQKPAPRSRATFTPDGLYVTDANGKQVRKDILDAGDSGVFLRGSKDHQVNIWSQPMGSGDIQEIHKDPNLAADLRRAMLPRVHADAPSGEWNRFVITLVGDRVTVHLNGEKIIDRALLPGIPTAGPIGLQYHRDEVEFTNIFIREL